MGVDRSKEIKHCNKKCISLPVFVYVKLYIKRKLNKRIKKERESKRERHSSPTRLRFKFLHHIPNSQERTLIGPV